VGLAFAAGPAPAVPLLAALVFLVGAGEAFFRPAAGALLPTVLPEEHLAAGNALTSTTAQLAQVVGPGAAGLLIAVADVRAGFLLAAVAFGVSALLLLRVQEPPHEPAPRARVLGEALEGLAAVRERPWLAACLLMFSFNMLLVLAPVQVLLPLVVRDETGRTATYGVVLSVGAVGGICGALLATRLRPATRGRVSLLAVTSLALEPLGLLAHLPLPALAVCWALSSAGLGLFIVVWESALQADVPRAVLARVVSLDWMATFALFPLGLALAGPAVVLVGRGPVLVVAAVVGVLPPVVLLRVPGARAFRTPITAASAAPAS
ncbi:MAG: major facilitator superfamily protein, partial [Frankiales bacterium]|nr:major facilitator superfamily protein [Frankiales bacterium]